MISHKLHDAIGLLLEIAAHTDIEQLRSKYQRIIAASQGGDAGTALQPLPDRLAQATGDDLEEAYDLVEEWWCDNYDGWRHDDYMK